MITLQIKYRVAEEKRAAFERMMHEVYPPALAVQKGFIESRLLRLYDQALLDEIEATPDPYDFELELTFESEQLRRDWVASPEHDPAFDRVKEFTTDIVHCGWNVAHHFVPTEKEVSHNG